jgi:hypothetical protein
VHLVVLTCVGFKPLVCLLCPTTKPLFSTESSVLFSSLLDSVKWLGLGAREITAIKTNVNTVLLAALPNAERGAAIASLTPLSANKPRVGICKELQSLAKLGVIELLCRMRHPVLESVRVRQFGQQGGRIPKRGVAGRPGASATEPATVSHQVFGFHRLSPWHDNVYMVPV